MTAQPLSPRRIPVNGWMTRARRHLPGGRSLVILIPVLWLLVFFLLPFAVVAKISVSEAAIARPPYLPIWDWNAESLTISLNFANYTFLIQDSLYYIAYLESLKIAAISTGLTLLLGYPMAYLIAKSPPRQRNTLLLLVMLPFWTSFLLRVYAWIGLLKDDGFINQALIGLGVRDAHVQLLNTDFAVYVGIVYSYLPFMILPLYSTLIKLDDSLIEAASDLGARPIRVFFTVTLPLSLNGIIAGSMLVFIPAVGEFVIPALLGGPDTLMIGKVLWNEFFSNRDWPVASAVAIVMLFVLVVPIGFLQRAQYSDGSMSQ